MKKIILIIPGLVILLMLIIVVRMKSDSSNPYPEISVSDASTPSFKEINFPFVQKHNNKMSLPFMASAIIDIDNDGIEEVFIGGGYNQQDGLFAYKNGNFVDVSNKHGLGKKENDTTYGSVALDINNDEYPDLIVARDSGVYLYTNEGGSFAIQNLNISLDNKTTPLSVAISDLNRDGHFDMFVSGYIKNEFIEGQNIFNKEGYGGTSAMLLNNGDNTFRNITKESGLYYLHNTFQAIFIDLDNDQLEDLVVAHDTGQVRTWKNLGNLKFKNMPNPNSEQSSYPMGIAVADYNNDGRMDLFFSNIGSTPPDFIVKGDLRDDQVFNRKWILFRNEGNFKFTDVAEEAKVADFEFSWGAIFEDFNLDGLQDLVVSENYIGFPPHKPPFLRLPGRFLVQKQNHQFAASGKRAGIVNSLFSISPLSADFNDDGYPDLLHINLNGPVKAFINNGGDNNFLKVKLPNVPASIGATVKIVTSRNTSLTETFISGEGLCSDQSHVLVFGLGDIESVYSVTVDFLTGEKKVIENPTINTTVRIS
jgi:enediyne biosynthesis protein E4